MLDKMVQHHNSSLAQKKGKDAGSRCQEAKVRAVCHRSSLKGPEREAGGTANSRISSSTWTPSGWEPNWTLGVKVRAKKHGLL